MSQGSAVHSGYLDHSVESLFNLVLGSLAHDVHGAALAMQHTFLQTTRSMQTRPWQVAFIGFTIVLEAQLW